MSNLFSGHFSELKDQLETLYLEDAPLVGRFFGRQRLDDGRLARLRCRDGVAARKAHQAHRRFMHRHARRDSGHRRKCGNHAGEDAQMLAGTRPSNRSASLASARRAVVLGQRHRARLSAAQPRLSLVYLAPQN